MSVEKATSAPTVTTYYDGAIAVLEVCGELDLHAGQSLRAAFNEFDTVHVRDVVMDLTGAAFLDSSALGIIIAIYKRIRDAGGVLRVVSPDRRVRQIFELTGVEKVVALFETCDAALAAVSAQRNGFGKEP